MKAIQNHIKEIPAESYKSTASRMKANRMLEKIVVMLLM